MFIALENLFNGGIDKINLDYSFDFSSEKFNEVFPFITDVKLQGEITNRAGLVEIDAVAGFDFSAPCDRCAAETKKHFDVPVKHGLVPSLNNDDNDDYIVVENMELDILNLTLEDVFLFLPSKYLCKEDCKGICSRCGTNLNEKSCGCKKEVDPRLAALLDLLD
ncbi:MAG: DUF177 domain-containing protein [Clostridia bacterium]|nr:DUF177 domain-containing protein [Clostridia bacterium]